MTRERKHKEEDEESSHEDDDACYIRVQNGGESDLVVALSVSKTQRKHYAPRLRRGDAGRVCRRVARDRAHTLRIRAPTLLQGMALYARIFLRKFI